MILVIPLQLESQEAPLNGLLMKKSQRSIRVFQHHLSKQVMALSHKPPGTIPSLPPMLSVPIPLCLLPSQQEPLCHTLPRLACLKQGLKLHGLISYRRHTQSSCCTLIISLAVLSYSIKYMEFNQNK